jgi:hypothetical protein
VSLFVVLLAVFTWALHHRVAQYESMQAVGSHVPAAKMCLTERNRISLPSIASLDAPAVAGAAVLFLACIPVSAGNTSKILLAALAFRRGLPGSSHTHPDACLNHFFSLPPPSLSFSA